MTRLRPFFKLAWATLLTILFCLTARADIDDFIRAQLNSVSAGTSPRYYEALDRGVYYGGSYQLRNQIKTFELLHFEAPHINAGCGGIDLYGGSFSFINKEQFNQLLKSVASNAVGYSFNLALTHVCPTCAQVVETLQRKIQQINQHLGNTCALAQGIVNDGVAALTNSTNNKISLLATVKGLGDSFSTHSANQAEAKKEIITEPAQRERFYGNLVYKAIRRTYSEEEIDRSYLEDIMSITGTVVATPGTDEQNKDSDQLKQYTGTLITVNQMVNGQTGQRYRCTNEDCTGLNVVEEKRESIIDKLKRAYLGNESIKGIIELYATNEGRLSEEQKRLLATAQDVAVQVRQLAIVNQEAARKYFLFAVKSIGLAYFRSEIEKVFNLVETAIPTVEEDSSVATFRSSLAINKQIYFQQIDTELAKHNDLDNLGYYKLLVEVLSPEHGGVKPK